jgi:cell division protease FtsH
MSDRLGPLQYGKPDGEVFLGRDYTRSQDLSNEVAAAIDEEIRFLITQAHDEARLILDAHRVALDRVAQVLMDKETLDAGALGEVFHDVPKWEHTESGSLRIKAPKNVEVQGGLAAVHSERPASR